MKQIYLLFLVIFTISTGSLLINCVSKTSEPAKIEKSAYYLNKNLEELKDLWLASKDIEEHKLILKELERRKAIDALMSCYNVSPKEGKTIIIQAFGRLKDSKAVPLLVDLISDEYSDLRTVALDALAAIKDPHSIDSIYPLLFDNDPSIRAQAAFALGEIGDPRAIGRISLLLADNDPFVVEIAEASLKRLGATGEKIKEWKEKATGLTIDDLYASKRSYEKAISEKAVLEAKLISETDIRLKLKNSLQERESALKRKENIIASLYEKERQLKSKQAQLDLTQQQSEDYEEELQRLNAKVESLNAQLKLAETQTATATVKEELDKTLEAKSELEQESKNAAKKESQLREEIVSITVLAEKTRAEAEAAKKEINTLRDREKQLAAQVDELKKRLNRGMAPVVVISKPEDGIRVQMPTTMLHIVAVDDKGIRSLGISLNDKPIELEATRGVHVVGGALKKKIAISEKLNLQEGQNDIKISVVDSDGIEAEEIITIFWEKQRGKIWAAIIGINKYSKARNLKYAVNDALAFQYYLRDYIGVAKENIFFLSNQDATRDNIQSLLGTKLKRKVSKEDTVLIFYAGHGAVETDPSSPDGDGFEKYLLPFDANLNDLYASAISMDEVRKIFMRIRSDRLIFIADTCYSGASGGRTMLSTKTRANLSDKFYERISKGKGRVIISSCSANEVSKEDDDLQHGIFSYYMLEGLKGKADQDGDGIITVSELFSYISRKVPEASAQDQHPVKKGETEGELVIGKTK
jgi:HEAT repeat protein